MNTIKARDVRKMDPLFNAEDMDFMLANLGDAGAQNQDEIIPDFYDLYPTNEYYAGNYNFKVLVPSSRHIFYSQRLNKLFIKMLVVFTVQFKCTYPADKEFFVRAKPRFCLPSEAKKPVKRCRDHFHEENAGHQNHREHILRCITTQAQYFGGSLEHCSVLAPLQHPEVGTDTVLLTYQFACHNSCGGMNRRETEVIFTLEDAWGNVYGRSSINFKACSGPKRDKYNEEVAYCIQHGEPLPPSKKRMRKKRSAPVAVQHSDNIQAVTINVVGLENKKALLKYCYELHAGRLLKGVANPDLYTKCLEAIKRLEDDDN